MNRIISTKIPTIFRPTSTILPRQFSTSTLLSSQPTFNKPGPPLLSRSEQKDFDELQRKVNLPATSNAFKQNDEGGIVMEEGVTEEKLTMHPDFRKKVEAQFEGEVNPVTGEVGGSKYEPLGHGDWQVGGRCTDF